MPELFNGEFEDPNLGRYRTQPGENEAETAGASLPFGPLLDGRALVFGEAHFPALFVRTHERIAPFAGNGEAIGEQRNLHAAALVDDAVTAWNAADIVPAVAPLFEIVVSADGHKAMYPSLDPNLSPNSGGWLRRVKDDAKIRKDFSCL